MSSNLDVGPFSGSNIAVFQDVQADSVAGQTINITATVQHFNTTIISKNWVTLSSNQFVLDAGVYSLVLQDAGYPASSTNNELQYWLRDTLGVTYTGSKLIASSASDSLESNQVRFFLDLSSGGKTIELYAQLRQNTLARNATNLSNGDSEFYQMFIIQKIG